MNAPTAIQITVHVKKVENLISASKRFIEEGKMVDLSSLGEKVRILSEDLQKCDRQVASPFIKQLEKLVDSLGEIEKMLEASQQNMEKNQSELKHKKARNAYQKGKKNE